MKCLRCGIETPRLTPTQRHCIECARQVAELIESDRKRWGRFPAKDLSGLRR